MQAALKDVGFSIKFKMTPAMRDALNASLDENVGLIKSIPEQYLLDVQGIISRAYTRGENLQELIKRIKKVYPKAANRAAVIARDQSNKASAVMLRIRHMEIGITRAIWKHSHGGKTPRPDHVKADGREYDIVKGCLISGEYIQPGQLINCRCVNRVILPSLQKR
jgi:SPP1 gp7 family putative phage head morphogenesis protein